jgi:RimJ/RimL family protein N-acetyltransferase
MDGNPETAITSIHNDPRHIIMTTTNTYGQPIGDPVPDWAPARVPETARLHGRYCTLERLDPARHADDLYTAHTAAQDNRDWTYLPVGPFTNRESFDDWADEASRSADPRHYAVIDNATGRALGTLSLMRHNPANGVIEVGYVVFSRGMQRTPMSTEAHYLLMRHVFDDLGYRRYEWKCDSLNARSRTAAERLGFTCEGTFRQAVVVKGHNRDTAWYALLDEDWPQVRAALEIWLDPGNFTADLQQIESLQTR